MSHVDDGTLHAFLDDELPEPERARLTAHLSECGSCRARLDEERDLIARAGALLGRAAPPRAVREPPPLRARGGRWATFQVPLAWAATLVIAFAVGWYAQGERLTRGLTLPPPPSPSDQSVAAPEPQAGSRARDEMRPQETRPRDTRPEPRARPFPAVPAPSAKQRQSEPAPAEPLVATRKADPSPLVDFARVVLGQPAVVLPGHPVLSVARAPDGFGIVVLQQLAPGTVIRLYERPTGAGAPQLFRAPAQRSSERAQAGQAVPPRTADASERLARYVGSVRVEISGPLGTDSLEKLLELVR